MHTANRPVRSAARALASLALVAAPALALDDPQFDSRSRSFPTGGQDVTQAYRPFGVALEDLDQDGDLDAAFAHVGNFINPHVSVQRNAGDGTFGPAEVLPASGETTDVVAADLDGDGDADLAFSQSDQGIGGEAVLVYVNVGGTFATELSISTGVGPTDIVAFDADLDGDVDLATPNRSWNEEDVSVLLNDGSGTAFARTDFALDGSSAVRLAAGDLDGDGAPELAASIQGGTPDFAVLTNDGAGAFGAPTFYSAGYPYITDAGIAIADLDLDGDRDVLYGRDSDLGGLVSSVSLYDNTGSGVLAAPVPVGTSNSFGTVYEFAVEDVTGDGWPDVLGVAQSSDRGFCLIPSTGGGAFGAASVHRTGEMARAIAVGDLDGDGDRDVVVANSGSLTMTVHENDGGFTLPEVWPAGGFLTKGTASGDVDNDGDLDFVATDSQIHVMKSDGAGGYAITSVPAFTSSLSFPHLEDVTGDGFLDLVASRGNELAVYANDGAGNFPSLVTWPLGSNARGLELGDVNGDGALDGVVTSHGGFSSPALVVIFGDGAGNFGPPLEFFAESFVGPDELELGDIDLDGDLDVVTAHGSLVGAWLGNGNGTFAGPFATGLGDGGTLDMVLADFDGDGYLDVAGTGGGSTFAGETLTVALGYGDGEFQPPTTWNGLFSLQFGGARGLGALDADQDGDLDLVAGCYGADDVALFSNDGTGSFGAEQRYGVAGHVLALAIADADGDGLDDVVVNLSASPPLSGGVSILRGLPYDPYTTLSGGLAGTNGVPRLDGVGAISAGAPVSFVLSDALESTICVYVIGVSEVALPLFGGVLVPFPDALVPTVTDFDGAAEFDFAWPPAAGAGQSLFAQVWVIDPVAVEGLAASNGLEATHP